MKIGRPSLLAVLVVVALICLPRMAAQQSVTVETLNQFVAAFNANNLDAVMNFFADFLGKKVVVSRTNPSGVIQ